MTQLERTDLHAAIETRYPDNTTEDITPLRLREGLHELVDSVFVTATDTGAVPNVPLYSAGTTYAQGFTVRHTVPGGAEAFYYSLQAGKLPAPVAVGDVNWKVVPGPVPATQLGQTLTLTQARNINGDSVVLGRDYAIELPPSPSGHAQYLSVAGIAENWFASEGYLVSNNVRTPIENIDYVAGTWRTKGTLNTRYGTILFGTAASERSRALGFQDRVALNGWALLGNGVIGDFQFQLVKNQTAIVGTYLTTGDLNVAIGSLTAAECAAGYYVLAQYGGTATNVVVNFKALTL